MDLKSLLCGLNPVRSRSASIKERKGAKAKRKHLPLPAGEYTVGCMDIITEYGKDGLFMRLYYPTNSTDIIAHESEWPLWLPDKRYGYGYVYFRRCNPKLHGRLFNFLGGDVYSPVIFGAAPHTGSHRFPIVMFSHGLGGNRTTCSTLCTEIASHGYIVACLEHRDGTASMTYYLHDPLTNNNRDSQDDLYDNEVKGQGQDDPTHNQVTQQNDNASTASTASGIEINMKRTMESSTESSKTKVTSTTTHSQQKANKSKSKSKKDKHKGGVEWVWYEQQENEEDFELRNSQVKFRTAELQRALSLLEKINNGDDCPNLLNPTFDLAQLAGKLDLDKIVAAGHSFGASGAIALAGQDKRIKCCLSFDVWMLPLEPYMYAELDVPLLLLTTEKFGWYDNMKLTVEELKPDTEVKNRNMLTIRNTCHQSYSDFQFLVGKRFGKQLWLVDEMKPRDAMNIVSQTTNAFLNTHLDIPGSRLEDVMTAQHELIVKGTTVDLSKPPPPVKKSS